MSEYQYYEFHALDRPLTYEAQEEMHSLSSRVQLTATSASFVYNYSNFPGDPYRILAQYFDVMLYITNWGTRQLLFRFPLNSIPDKVMVAYQYADGLEWSVREKWFILNIELNEEESDDGWIEGQGMLSGLVQVRDDILHGDYRALYLAWLKFAHEETGWMEEDEDLTEPPIPPNLQTLSPTLRNFIDFFMIDDDLVTAAAQASPTAVKADENLSMGIDRLSEAEKRDFLERLLNGESHLDIALANRLRQLSGTDKVEFPMSERRTIRQLSVMAEKVTQQRREVERQQAEAARLKKLEKLAQQQDKLWARIPGLIEQKKANAYDEAVSILKDLRDLAEHQQRLGQFEDRLAVIQNQYPTLRGLHSRLKEAGLI